MSNQFKAKFLANKALKLAGPADRLEPYLTQIELLSEHPIKLE